MYIRETCIDNSPEININIIINSVTTLTTNLYKFVLFKCILLSFLLLINCLINFQIFNIYYVLYKRR